MTRAALAALIVVLVRGDGGNGLPSSTTSSSSTPPSSFPSNFEVNNAAEITLEANPDDLNKEKLKAYVQMGINRLSIGIQSFIDRDLIWMNRAHNSAEAKSCIKRAQDIGIENLSVDLIYGLPELSDKEWQENIAIALSHDIPHISSYALTVEEKTALASFINNGKRKPLVEEKTAYQFEILQSVMADNQFIHYEISNFCKEGHYAKHNTAYWKGHSYLGIGPSAHSYNQSTREWNIANNHQYIDQIRRDIIPSTIEILSLENRMNEYLMLSLRTIWGADLNYFEDAFGSANKNILLQKAEDKIKNKWLSNANHKLNITNNGKLMADKIAAELFF
jgi:oxygen-independent coproporphyrinogen-3 oxidase